MNNDTITLTHNPCLVKGWISLIEYNREAFNKHLSEVNKNLSVSPAYLTLPSLH